MAEDTQLPIRRADDPMSQDAMSSFVVWARTTMLGAEDDADLAENDVVLRGID